MRPYDDLSSDYWMAPIESADWRSVQVTIFHEHPVFLEGLVGWLRELGMEKIQPIGTANCFLQRSIPHRENEIVILDIGLIVSGPLSGNENVTCREIIDRLVFSNTIVVTTREMLAQYGQQVPKNFGGLISPKSRLSTFGKAVQSLADGNRFVTTRLRETWQSLQSANQFELTPRQLEILKYVARGDSSKQIAAKLKISRKTVENHRSEIMKRMKVDSAGEMVGVATRRGLC